MNRAFAHLNLRRNPFGELTIEERAALAVVDLDDAAGRLRRGGHAVQILGPCGYGKTTQLLALRERVPGLLCLDEAQFLKRIPEAPALALATHVDLAPKLRGYTVETIRLEAPTVGRLAEIVARRIESSRRGPGPVPGVRRATLEALLARHGGDVRAIEGELYEAFQRLEAVGDV